MTYHIKQITALFFSCLIIITISIPSILLLNCSSTTNKETNTPILQWKYKTGFQIISSPAIDNDGNIYFGSQDYYIYALDSSGKEIWKKKLGNKINSTPTIYNDLLYIGCQNTYLYVINTKDGTIINRYKTDDSIHGSIAIDDFGNIYFGSYDSTFYALNPDMTTKWKYKTNGFIDSAPAIDKLGNIYIGSADGSLYAFSTNDKNPLWEFTTQNKITASPAIGRDNTIYIGSHDKFLYAINPDGTEKWSFKTNGKILSSVAITSNNNIVLASYDHHVYMINDKGTLLWKKSLGSNISSSPAIGKDGSIFIGAYNNRIYMINSRGDITWNYSTSSYILSSPAISKNGNIYVGSADFYLYAFKTNSAGYTISAWPGYGAGSDNLRRVKTNLINTTRPYFQIVKTDSTNFITDISTNKQSAIASTENSISSISGESQNFIYITNNISNGLDFITLDTKGKILQTQNINSTPPSNPVFNTIETLNRSNKNLLLGLENRTNSFYVFTINNTTGIPEELYKFQDTLLYEIKDPVDISQITIDTSTYFYVLGHQDHGISVFKLLDNENTVQNIFNIDNVENFRYALNSPNKIITFTANNTPYLIVSSQVENGISLFNINADGSLNFLDSIFDLQSSNFSMKSLNSIAIISSDDRIFLATGSMIKNTISIFLISNKGLLQYITSLDFTQNKNYGIQELKSISTLKIDNNYYVVVYGTKNVSTIFTIDNNNTLFQLAHDPILNTALIETSYLTELTTNNDTFLLFAKKQEEKFDVYKIVK